jgi:hypothetical protein
LGAGAAPGRIGQFPPVRPKIMGRTISISQSSITITCIETGRDFFYIRFRKHRLQCVDTVVWYGRWRIRLSLGRGRARVVAPPARGAAALQPNIETSRLAKGAGWPGHPPWTIRPVLLGSADRQNQDVHWSQRQSSSVSLWCSGAFGLRCLGKGGHADFSYLASGHRPIATLTAGSIDELNEVGRFLATARPFWSPNLVPLSVQCRVGPSARHHAEDTANRTGLAMQAKQLCFLSSSRLRRSE